MFSGIVLVGFVCAVIVQLSVCEEVDVSEEAGSSQEAKSEEQDPRKDGKAGLISGELDIQQPVVSDGLFTLMMMMCPFVYICE